MSDFEEQMEFQLVKLQVLNKVFSTDNIKKRVNSYVDQIYAKSDDNRKIRKAYKNQLMDILKKENEITKQNIRMLQKKKPVKVRKRREYKPTPYVLFCREMRSKHPHEELSGRMQQLWRDHRSKCNCDNVLKDAVCDMCPIHSIQS